MALYYSKKEVDDVIDSIMSVIPRVLKDVVVEQPILFTTFDTRDSDFEEEDISYGCKPCPICGHKIAPACFSNEEVDEEPRSTIRYTVVCNYNNGGCGCLGGYRKTKIEAVKHWNNRV